MTEYLLLVGVVFAVNLLPAFGPPSWTLLVFFNLRYDLPIPAVVLLGAFAAASGRYVLGSVAYRLRGRLSPRRLTDLDALRTVAEQNRSTSYGALALFALSPLPSAQLFVAAGITGVRLLPLTAAFFTGRLVSYTIYSLAAAQAARGIETILREGVTSPAGIALQILMLAGVVALVFVPWSRLLRRYLPN